MKLKNSLKLKKSKILFSLLILIAAIVLIIVSVNAKYLKYSNEVKNTFSPAVSVLPTIQEDFNKSVKKNVKIEVGDTGYPVYVRAALVVNWQEKGKENGDIYFKNPVEGKDYTLTINDEYWELKSDGYYYYKNPVPSNDVTEPLILECKPISPAPDDNYSLSVIIHAQTVQAVGETDDGSKSAQEDAWNLPQPTTESTSE